MVCLCNLGLDEKEKAKQHCENWIQTVQHQESQIMRIYPIIFMVALHNTKDSEKKMLKYAEKIVEQNLKYSTLMSILKRDQEIMKLFFSSLKIPRMILQGYCRDRKMSKKQWRFLKLTCYVNGKIKACFE